MFGSITSSGFLIEQQVITAFQWEALAACASKISEEIILAVKE